MGLFKSEGQKYYERAQRVANMGGGYDEFIKSLGNDPSWEKLNPRDRAHALSIFRHAASNSGNSISSGSEGSHRLSSNDSRRTDEDTTSNTPTDDKWLSRSEGAKNFLREQRDKGRPNLANRWDLIVSGESERHPDQKWVFNRLWSPAGSDKDRYTSSRDVNNCLYEGDYGGALQRAKDSGDRNLVKEVEKAIKIRRKEDGTG